MRVSTAGLAICAGIAKPMPENDPDAEMRKVLIPTTSPRAFTSAPPELPGLIAASVWMNSPGLRGSSEYGLALSIVLTVPRLDVKQKPKETPNSCNDQSRCKVG